MKKNQKPQKAIIKDCLELSIESFEDYLKTKNSSFSGIINWSNGIKIFIRIFLYDLTSYMFLRHILHTSVLGYEIGIYKESQIYSFVCNKCSRRVLKLYSIKGKSQFLCEKCFNPKYIDHNKLNFLESTFKIRG